MQRLQSHALIASSLRRAVLLCLVPEHQSCGLWVVTVNQKHRLSSHGASEQTPELLAVSCARQGAMQQWQTTFVGGKADAF